MFGNWFECTMLCPYMASYMMTMTLHVTIASYCEWLRHALSSSQVILRKNVIMSGNWLECTSYCE
jgi:hypothetical protein